MSVLKLLRQKLNFESDVGWSTTVIAGSSNVMKVVHAQYVPYGRGSAQNGAVGGGIRHHVFSICSKNRSLPHTSCKFQRRMELVVGLKWWTSIII